MFIGHIGTGGTGKSTLAEEVAGVLELTYRPSVVREVYNEFGWNEASQRTAPLEACWKLQKEMFRRKMYQDKYLYRDTVVDRTPIDHLAYCIYWCEEALIEDMLKEYEEQARIGMAKYDLVIYHPIPSWKGTVDGIREDQYVYRRIIDVIMLGYLNSFEVPYILVPDADIKSQRDSIYEYVKRIEKEQSPSGILHPIRERAPHQ